MNQYLVLRVARDGLHVQYRIDFAENPTAGELRQLDADSDGTVTDAERKKYLASRSEEWAARLTATVNGKDVALKPSGENDLKLSDGAGGRKTLLVMLDFVVPPGALAAAGTNKAELTVGNYTHVAGWREAAALAGEGWWIVDGDRPAKAKVLDTRGVTGDEEKDWAVSLAFAQGKPPTTRPK